MGAQFGPSPSSGQVGSCAALAWNLRSQQVRRKDTAMGPEWPRLGGKTNGYAAHRLDGKAAAGSTRASSSVRATSARADGGRPVLVRLSGHHARVPPDRVRAHLFRVRGRPGPLAADSRDRRGTTGSTTEG